MTKELYRGNKLSFAFLLFASLFETAVVILTSLMIEKVLAIATSKTFDALINQGAKFLILLFFACIIYTLVTIIKPRYRKKAITQYKNRVYSKLLEKNIDSFNKHETSTYISSFTNDVTYIEDNYIFSIFDLITQITLFVCSLVIMIAYSPLLSFVAIILSLLPLAVALIIGSRLEGFENKISNQNGSFMHFIKDNMIGYSTIKIFKSEYKIKELFKKENNKLEDLKKRKTRTIVLIEFLQAATQTIAQFGVFFFGAFLCIRNKNFSPSVLILFVQLMNYVMMPLATIPSIISKRRAAKPLFKKIETLLEDDSAVIEQEILFNKKISINKLNFSYDEKSIINNLDLEIEKNKSYAIVGTSGSGKTTLLNLMIGKNKNYSGEIKYDELEIKGISPESLYEVVSYVEQNVFVFDDTIINNITMYSEVNPKLLEEVIKKSGLSSLIKEKGIDYKCGESGCNLSGGEKQRISIARALLKNSQILLMDEATSALDNDTSSSIMSNVLNLSDITKVVITHKLDENILKKFDEIIVMSKGCIVEKDAFDNLINKKGIFYSLYNIE